jgi:hypothetical protein
MRPITPLARSLPNRLRSVEATQRNFVSDSLTWILRLDEELRHQQHQTNRERG